MSEVRDTSLKTFNEIQEEGIYDSRMQEVLDAVKKCPMMTGRELAEIVLYYNDMNIVRPRISDLARLGYIVEAGKRKCSMSGRTCYVWVSVENSERGILKKLGFKEQEKDLYTFKEDDITLYQDFRKGRRISYAFDESGVSIAHSTLDIHKKLKEELLKLYGGGSKE